MKAPRILADLRELQRVTSARIGLPRAGASIATREMLQFDLDHARARDAVHLPLDVAALDAALRQLGLEALAVNSAAGDRTRYLQRPDLGRRLDDISRDRVQAASGEGAPDLALVVGDGLSARAIHENAVPLLAALLPLVKARGWRTAPLVVAEQARVALADEIGELFSARLAVILIGERPGLSAADSLGIYLTYAPRRGCTDAQRNCISNVRAGGLDCSEAATLLDNLIASAFAKGLSGVELKDDRVLLEG